jgi:hypothetical protein
MVCRARRQVAQHVDEVEPAEGDAAAGAGGDLVLDPPELGLAGQGGDVEAEFLVEFAGERGRGDRTAGPVNREPQLPDS